MESFSHMNATVRAVWLKAEAMLEMNFSRYSGVGDEVVVVGGRVRGVEGMGVDILAVFRGGFQKTLSEPCVCLFVNAG